MSERHDSKATDQASAGEGSQGREVGDNRGRSVLQRVAGSQSSVVTILALWNTMIATSVLSLPWAIKEAGLVCGVVSLILMAAIMGYTCHLVLHSVDRLPEGQMLEFQDVCGHYVGRWAKGVALAGSLLSLLGGMIIYWLLLATFLYHIGSFVHNRIYDISSSALNASTEQYDYAVCDASAESSVCQPCAEGGHRNSSNSGSLESGSERYRQWWSETRTIPVFLVALLFPLLHFRRATVFTSMNSVGMLSLVYLVVLVAIKAARWGVNLDLHTGHSSDSALYTSHYAPQFRWSLAALTGVASLGYFVHNSVLSIVRNQRRPQHNTRDLILAYCLVAVTYIYVGAVFYFSFPFNKDCIDDNLLDNISSDDLWGLVARGGLCFQLTCIFPQLAYIARIQLFTALFGSPWPGVCHVVVLNTLVVTTCVLFAVFLPHIGRILSFVGALCGFCYGIGLPCLVHCLVLRQEGRLTYFRLALHVLLPFLGLVNFVAQFLLVE